MPRVRLLNSVSGVDVNYSRGDEVDLPPSTAQSWVEAGMAELVREETPETPEAQERRTAKPETTASKSKAAGRKSS